jgi:hypothetical protein
MVQTGVYNGYPSERRTYACTLSTSDDIVIISSTGRTTYFKLTGISAGAHLKYNHVSGKLMVYYGNKLYIIDSVAPTDWHLWINYTTYNNISSCDVDYETGDMYVFCNTSSSKTIYRFDSSGVFQDTYAVHNFSSTPSLRYGSFIPYGANWIHIPQERWQYRVIKNPIAPWDLSWAYFAPWIDIGWPCQIDAAYNKDTSVRCVYTMALSSYGIRGYPYNKTTGLFGTQNVSFPSATYGTGGTNTFIVKNKYIIYKSGSTLYMSNISDDISLPNRSIPFNYTIRNISVSKSISNSEAVITTGAPYIWVINPFTGTATQSVDVVIPGSQTFFAVSLQ